MTSKKNLKLEKTITALQDRWGSQAVGRLQELHSTAVSVIPTGFPDLDGALTIGGLPRGRISEIGGAPTSGVVTVALKITANAQLGSNSQATGTAVYIDLRATFDPVYAVRCGISLEHLLLVRPENNDRALSILQDLIHNAGAQEGGINIVIFDNLDFNSEIGPLSETLGRLIAPLSQSNCALIFLTSQPPISTTKLLDQEPGSVSPRQTVINQNQTLAHYASVRLFLRRERWLYKKQDVRGYIAQVTVQKNKLGPGQKRAEITIFHDDINNRSAGRKRVVRQ